MSSNNLNIPQVASSQTSKEVTINAATTQLGQALTAYFPIDLTAGTGATVLAADFESNLLFQLENGTTTQTVTLPAVQRGLFLVRNDSAHTHHIVVGSTSVDVAASTVALFQTDGTTNGLALVTTSAAGGSIASDTILANITGGSAAPVASTISAILDALIGNTQGGILFRSSSLWAFLAHGVSGQALLSGGAGADVAWGTAGYSPGTPPTVVQSAADVSGGASITLGGAPTNGNLLIAMCFNPTTATAGSGWTQVASVSTGTDFGTVFSKVAGASESATQSPLNSSPGGTGAIMIWEIHGQAGSGPVLAAASQAEGAGLVGVGPVFPNLANVLSLSAMALVSASNNINKEYGVTQDQIINSGTVRQIVGGHSTLATAPLAQLFASFTGSGTPGSKGAVVLITA